MSLFLMDVSLASGIFFLVSALGIYTLDFVKGHCSVSRSAMMQLFLFTAICKLFGTNSVAVAVAGILLSW